MCKMLELAEDTRSILEKEKKGDVVYQQFRNLVMYKIDCEHQSLSRLTYCAYIRQRLSTKQ